MQIKKVIIMKKKLLLFVVVLGMGAISFAQGPKDNAIKAVEAKQKELLTNLKSIDGIQQKELKGAKEVNQFWIEQGKTIQYGTKKSKIISASDKFDKYRKTIKKKNGFDVKDFSYNDPKMSKAEAKTDKKGKVDEHSFVIVYDIHKCQTKLSNSYKDEAGKEIATNYEACYNLTMTWIVKINKKQESKIDAITLESIKATPNRDKEILASINKEVNRLIKEWYDNNIPAYFTDKVQGDVIINSQLSPSQPSGYKIDKIQKTVTVTSNLPTVRLNVDPKKHMSTDSMYVDNPTAFYTFTPKSFTINFPDDYKQGELSVEFEKGTLTGPQTLSSQERNMREAVNKSNQAKNEIFSIIEDFTKSPNAENTKRFKSMFAENAMVEIAYLTKKGVKRETKDCSKYVNRLKGVDVAMDQIGTPTLPDITVEPWTVSIPYTQRTSYGKYCDRTNKRINLVKDSNGSFKIASIVVDNDPVPCE